MDDDRFDSCGDNAIRLLADVMHGLAAERTARVTDEDHENGLPLRQFPQEFAGRCLRSFQLLAKRAQVAAVGVPVVALFGPTDPGLTSPRGPVAVVSRPTPCAPCFYRVCPIEHPCLRAITADEVEARLRPLLSQWA